MNDMSTTEMLARGDLSKITTYKAGVAQAYANRMLRKVSDEALKSFGISKMQWLIIGTVLDSGKAGTRLTDLAENLGTTLSYITNTVNLLESRGMLIRKNSGIDGRSKFILINEEFAPKCMAIEQTLREALRKSIYANIDPKEFRIYMKVLYRLSEIGSNSKKHQ